MNAKSNPLPAALGSIKRYDFEDGAEYECRDGNWIKAADALATLPPPADGATPAESAMVEALREASYKCDDMAQSLELVSTEGMSNFGKHKIAKSIELFKELGTLLAGRK